MLRIRSRLSDGASSRGSPGSRGAAVSRASPCVIAPSIAIPMFSDAPAHLPANKKPSCLGSSGARTRIDEVACQIDATSLVSTRWTLMRAMPRALATAVGPCPSSCIALIVVTGTDGLRPL